MRLFNHRVILALLFGSWACKTTAPAPEAPPTTAPSTPASSPAPSPETSPVSVVYTGDAEASQSLPLVVALHGYGSRPSSMANLLSCIEQPARLAFPQAPDPTSSGGWSWFAIRRPVSEIGTRHQRLTTASTALLETITDLQTRYPTEGLPIVTGFSQGGMLSFALAAGWPDKLAAALPVGGTLPLTMVPTDLPAATPRPEVVAFHGTADKVVEMEGAEAAIAALSAQGYPTRFERYEGVAHYIPPPMRSALCDTLHQLLTPSTDGDGVQPTQKP